MNSHLEIQTIATLIIPKWKLADNDKSETVEEERARSARKSLWEASRVETGSRSESSWRSTSSDDFFGPRPNRSITQTLFPLLNILQQGIRLRCSLRISYLSFSLSHSQQANVNLHTRHVFIMFVFNNNPRCYVTQGWWKKRNKRGSGGIGDFRM